MVKSTVRSGSRSNARSRHVDSPAGPDNAVESVGDSPSSPEPFSRQTVAALAAATPEPTAAPAMSFGVAAVSSPAKAESSKQAFVEPPQSVFASAHTASIVPGSKLPTTPCGNVELHEDLADANGHKVAAESSQVQEGSSSEGPVEAPLPTFSPAQAAFTAPESSTPTPPGDAAGATDHKVTGGLPKTEQSSPSQAGPESHSFASFQPSGAAFGDSSSAPSSAFGNGQLPGGVHVDKPTSKDTLPGRRRVSLNKARIPAVRLKSSAGVSTASEPAQQAAATTAAEPLAFSGTGAAAKQAGFGTSIAFKAPFSRPGASAQPSGVSTCGNASSKEEDVGAMAREAIRIAREARAEVQTLKWRLDASQATISAQQRQIDTLMAQFGLKHADAIESLLNTCKHRILVGGPAASLEAYGGIAGVLCKALVSLTKDLVRVKFFVASEDSLSRLQKSMGATEVLKENEVMMNGGLAAVLNKNLMYICQLVDLRCQRVLEEADWRLRLARAIGPGAANAPGMEQNAKVYPVTKATVEEISEDDAPGHISDAATEDVTATEAAAADSPGIDAADSASAAVKDDAYTFDAAADTVHSGASIFSSQTASVGMPASSSATEGVSNIANSSEGLKQSSIDGNSAEETAAALDPMTPSEDMVGATQSADALVEAQPHKAAAVAEGTATRTDQNGSVQQHLATASLSAEQGLSAVVLNQNLSLPVVRLALTVDELSESPAVQAPLTLDQGLPAELVGHTSNGPIPTEAVAAEPAHTASVLAAMHPVATLEQVPSSEPLALPATEQEKFTDIAAGPADTAGDAAEQFIGLASLPVDSEDCLEGRQEKFNSITTGDAVDTNSDAIDTALGAVDTALDAVDAALDTVDTALDAAYTAIDAVDTASDAAHTAIDAVEHSSELAALLLDQADTARDAEGLQGKSITGATADTARDAAELSSGLATLLLDSDSSAADATADVSAAELVTVDKGECHAAVSHPDSTLSDAVSPASSGHSQSTVKMETDVARSGSGLGSESEVVGHTDFNVDDMIEEASAVSNGEAEANAVGLALSWKSALLLTLKGCLVVYAAAKWAGLKGSVYDTHQFPT